MRYYAIPKPCPNNPEAVVCMDDTQCNRCGWNPEVSKARIEEYKNRKEGEKK